MKVFALQCALILEKLVKAEFLGGNIFFVSSLLKNISSVA